MKTGYAFLASCSFVLAGTVYAIDLPGSVRGAAAARTTSSAAARLPRASAAAAGQARVGADVRASRLRAGASTDVRGSASLQRNRFRADGSSDTAARLRVGGERNPDTRPGREPTQPQRDETARDDRQRSGARFEHQARHYFTNRMAQIEHMRDVAVETGNINLLKRADQLEARLRDEMRRYSAELNARAAASQQIDAHSDAFHAQGQAAGGAAAHVSRQPRRPQPATGNEFDGRNPQPNRGTNAPQQTPSGADTATQSQNEAASSPRAR